MLRALLVTVLLVLGACTERGEVEPANSVVEPARDSQNSCAQLSGFAALSCAKPQWRQRDNELNRMLARLQAGADHGKKADLRSAQKRWEITRNACLDGPRPEREPCLEALYSARMNELTNLLD